MRTVRLFQAQTPAVRLLLANQCGISVGFYLLVPYLGYHLDNLGVAAVVVGAVLGVRTFAQQGLTFLGGAAVDRLGCRPMIIAGCALRVVAFVIFAIAADVTGLTVAAVLTGLAGALFSPAVKAYLALEVPDDRASIFALHNLSSTVGALAGPLVGSVLIVFGFQPMAWVSAGVFAALTIGQAFFLPAPANETLAVRPTGGWRQVLTDRTFLLFAAACGIQLTAYNQFYLLLPTEAVRVSNWAGATSAVFLLSTVLTLAFQVRLVSSLSRRLRPHTAIAAGLTLTGLAFVPGAASATWLPGSAPLIAVAILPITLATALLTVGLDVLLPFSLEQVTGFAPAGLTGTYLGVNATISGLLTALGNTLIGLLADLGARWQLPALPWLTLTALSIGSAIAVHALRPIDSGPSRCDRSGASPDPAKL